jgi:hypothetical protein
MSSICELPSQPFQRRLIGRLMALIVLFLLPAIEPLDDALPTVDVIRNAWKQNLDRYSNRRIKYVLVRLKGEHRKDFPNVDYPDRHEIEEVYSTDGRWRRHSVGKRPESLVRESEILESHLAWDGTRATTFYHSKNSNGSKPRVEIRGDKASPHEEHIFDMMMTQPVIDKLGIRSRVEASPLGKGLVLLNPYEDDRALSQERYTVDPSRNYWPVRKETWYPGEHDKYGQVAHEFAQTPDGWWYPKRVIQTWKDETRHYIVVDAQFPNSFDDLAFAVHLPDGVEVMDHLRRQTMSSPPPQRGLKEHLEDIPGEDWLFYGGFGAAVTAFVAASWYFMARKKPGTTSKAKK